MYWHDSGVQKDHDKADDYTAGFTERISAAGSRYHKEMLRATDIINKYKDQEWDPKDPRIPSELKEALEYVNYRKY